MNRAHLHQAGAALEDARSQLVHVRGESGNPETLSRAIGHFAEGAAGFYPALERDLALVPGGNEWCRAKFHELEADPVVAYFRSARSYRVRSASFEVPGRSVSQFTESPLDSSATTVEVSPVPNTPPPPPSHRRGPSQVPFPMVSEWRLEGWQGGDAFVLSESYLHTLERVLGEAERFATGMRQLVAGPIP